ncbi:MAG: ABC transporter substrate-binding protein [Pseudonocardia sp.]
MTSTLRDTFEPPDTTVRRRRRWWNRIVLAVVVVLLGSAAVVVGDTLVRTCGQLGSGVAMVDGECIGVTDGSYLFRQDYRDVESRIAEENTWVASEMSKPGDKSVVTVALFLPMTVEDDSPTSPEEVRNQMEGAYTAQRRLNRAPIAGDPNPLIRLVLANQGNRQQQWELVVEQLADMRDDQAPLVAVIGLGVSVEETERAAERLAEYNIPMVATLATADALNYETYPGFTRVAPSNHDQVKALRQYLDQKELTSAVLVEDTNQDLFVESMRANFTVLLRDLIEPPSATFKGVSTPTDATAGIFEPAVSRICEAQPRPQVVLFAGRKIDLRSFLKSLEARSCSTETITVVTVGSDTGALSTTGEPELQEPALREANIVVAVAATADPQRWKAGQANPPESFSKFFMAFQNHFDVEHLADGEAILTYDALLTAARAIRLAAASKPQQDEFVPSSADVGSQLTNLNTGRSISGAGGTLSFSTRGTDGRETGNPCGKPVPILESPSGPPVEPVFITCSDNITG